MEHCPGEIGCARLDLARLRERNVSAYKVTIDDDDLVLELRRPLVVLSQLASERERERRADVLFARAPPTRPAEASLSRESGRSKLSVALLPFRASTEESCSELARPFEVQRKKEKKKEKKWPTNKC